MVINGSGKPSYGLSNVVAIAEEFLFFIKCCNISISSKGRSHAVTSHAASGYSRKAESIPP
jgi:hypothetical protein